MFDEIEGRNRAEMLVIEGDGLHREVRDAVVEALVRLQRTHVDAGQGCAVVGVARELAATEVEVAIGEHREGCVGVARDPSAEACFQGFLALAV
ncbi:hypothetical protein [Silanimonas sp.]|uniref:hypothetical protein n=1 Tax=Silanimonas sp. TaxID=1929290 RepID=UPI0037C52213